MSDTCPLFWEIGEIMMKNKRGSLWKQKTIGILFQLPALAVISLTMIVPMIWNLVLSFFEWNGNGKAIFVGFQNFMEILNKGSFNKTYMHTLELALISTVVGLLLGLVMALCVFRVGKRESTLYRFLMFAPSIIPMTVVGLNFTFVLSPDMGILNNLLRAIGLGNLTHSWLAEPQLVLRVLGIIQGWRYSGIIMMLFYTSLLNIPDSLFEASKLDGCSYLKQIWYVILPLIRSTLQLSLSMLLIWTFKSYDIVTTMTNGGPGSASKTVPLKMIEVGFGNNAFGKAAAMAMVLTCIVVVFLLVARKVTDGEKYEL